MARSDYALEGRITLDTTEFRRSLNRANDSLDSIASASTRASRGIISGFNNINKAVGRAAAAYLSFASIRALGRLGLEAQTNAKEFGEFAQTLDITTDRIQALRAAFSTFGLENETLPKVFNKISASAVLLQQGSLSVVEAFERLGITYDDVKNKNPDEIFDLIADGAQRTTDAVARQSALVTILGARYAKALGPGLVNGSAAFKDFEQQLKDTGLILSEEGVDKALEADESFQRFAGTVKQFSTVAFQPFSNAMGDAAEGMDNFIKRTRLAERTARFLQGVLEGFEGVGNVLRNLDDPPRALVEWAKIVAGSYVDASDRIGEVSTKTKALAEMQAELKKTILENKTAQKEYAGVVKEAQEAEEQLAKARALQERFPTSRDIIAIRLELAEDRAKRASASFDELKTRIEQTKNRIKELNAAIATAPETKRIAELDAQTKAEEVAFKQRIANIRELSRIDAEENRKRSEKFFEEGAINKRDEERYMRQVESFQRAAEEARAIQETLQATLSDSFLSALQGDFDSIGDLWKSLLQRMVADALAADVTRALGIGDGIFTSGQTSGGDSSNGIFQQALGVFSRVFSGADSAAVTDMPTSQIININTPQATSFLNSRGAIRSDVLQVLS